MPLVSVITPAYKSNAFIAKAVRSVLAQGMQDFEIVIAANDGQDYRQILAGQNIIDSRIHYVSTEGVGTGPAHARNTALAHAKGRLIVTLDDDDFLRADTFELMVPKALEHGAAYSDLAILDFENGESLPNYNRRQAAGFLSLREILSGCLHSYIWIMFDRERLPDVHWHESLLYVNDMAMYAECAERLGGMYYTPARLYHYYRRNGSMSNMPQTMEKFMSDYAKLKRMHEENAFGYSNESRNLIIRYAQNWYDLEKKCQEAIVEGTYTEYLDFLRDHREMLYTL